MEIVHGLLELHKAFDAHGLVEGQIGLVSHGIVDGGVDDGFVEEEHPVGLVFEVGGHFVLVYIKPHAKERVAAVYEVD
jgi:hypothetical protein